MKRTSYEDVLSYYRNSLAAEEIAAFCKSRWVAIHCEKKTPQGVPYLVRYKGWKRKVPLTIQEGSDVGRLLDLFNKLSPRSFYGTINEYGRLENQEDMDLEDNIDRSTPIWDIDNVPDDWESTIKVAQLIVEFLEENGIRKSVFVKWSGRGAHVHLNASAFSYATCRRIGPLNIAYATVEYAIRSLKPRFRSLVESTKSKNLSVENKIDPKRIFTAPMSLHRSLFRACICVSPRELRNFDISWTNPLEFKHNTNWNRTAPGEGDCLADLAYGKIGPCPYTGRLHREKTSSLDEQPG